MALNVVAVTDAIMAHVRDRVPQDVFEQGVPDVDTIRRLPDGSIKPYVAVQFGVPWHKASGRGFAGVRFDDYELPVYVQVVAGDSRVARLIALDTVLDALIGFSMEGASEMVQRTGGSIFVMTQSTEASEAYVFPMSFSFTFQMMSS